MNSRRYWGLPGFGIGAGRRWGDSTDFEPFGAEDIGAEDDSPRIPEPMVFDLVRPLGARRGETEINVLALFPMNRRVGRRSDLLDPLGLESDGHPIDWAPEVEIALWDGFAVEFETPFLDGTFEAYKFAAQYTFGTAFDEKFIHGAQLIVQYDRHPDITTPTILYVFGIRFDERWSLLSMLGFRHEFNAPDIAQRTEKLVNVSLFVDLTHRFTLGIETNYAAALDGDATFLVMPQFHWEITDHIMLQAGAGTRFTPDYTLPEAGLRAILSF